MIFQVLNSPVYDDTVISTWTVPWPASYADMSGKNAIEIVSDGCDILVMHKPEPIQ